MNETTVSTFRIHQALLGTMLSGCTLEILGINCSWCRSSNARRIFGSGCVFVVYRWFITDSGTVTRHQRDISQESGIDFVLFWVQITLMCVSCQEIKRNKEVDMFAKERANTSQQKRCWYNDKRKIWTDSRSRQKIPNVRFRAEHLLWMIRNWSILS